MTSEPLNPYAAPQAAVDAVVPEPTAATLPSPTQTALKWTLICCVSTAPSFFYGLLVTQHPVAIPLMLLGIGCFVVFYSIIVRRPFSRELMARTLVGTCIRAAFGLRIFISIVFPIGAMNDMYVGLLSMGTAQLFSFVGDPMGGTRMSPGAIYLTTILQGIFLNAELFGAAFLFLLIARAVRVLIPE